MKRIVCIVLMISFCAYTTALSENKCVKNLSPKIVSNVKIYLTADEDTVGFLNEEAITFDLAQDSLVYVYADGVSHFRDASITGHGMTEGMLWITPSSGIELSAGTHTLNWIKNELIRYVDSKIYQWPGNLHAESFQYWNITIEAKPYVPSPMEICIVTQNATSSGQKFSFDYSISGGKKPYEYIDIYVTSHGYDGTDYFHPELLSERTGETSGSRSVTPYIGDNVSISVEVMDADGELFYESKNIVLNKSPKYDVPEVTGQLNKQIVGCGSTISVQYQVQGGSGKVYSGNHPNGYHEVCWIYVADGFVPLEYLQEKDNISSYSGTASFTPDKAGTYICRIRFMDSYNCLCFWEDSFQVITSANLPSFPNVGSNPEHGDVNADGVVDLDDVLRLLQYFAGWDVEISPKNSDVNNDGAVNFLDAKYMLSSGEE